MNGQPNRPDAGGGRRGERHAPEAGGDPTNRAGNAGPVAAPGGRWRLAVFAVPLVLAAGLLAWSWWPYGGQEVLLLTEPVDPPDPLRGDYVDLRYGVSTLRASGLQEGDTVYVTLAPGPRSEPGTGRPYWEVVHWGQDRPDVEAGQVCMKARVAWATTDRAHVRYGIESYFIQKDETLEDWWGKEVGVLVKVKGCTPRIAGIHLDGQPWP